MNEEQEGAQKDREEEGDEDEDGELDRDEVENVVVGHLCS